MVAERRGPQGHKNMPLTLQREEAIKAGFAAGYGMVVSWKDCPFTYGTAKWHLWLLGWRRGRFVNWRERKDIKTIVTAMVLRESVR